MWNLVGVLMVAAGIWLMPKVIRIMEGPDRRGFERTNSSGVQVFESYDAVKREQLRDQQDRVVGGILGFVGFALILVGVLILWF